MNVPRKGLKSTTNRSPPPSQATIKKYDFNISTQSKYKKITNFLNESHEIANKQQQKKQEKQNKKTRYLGCNCWVCKFLNSISISEDAAKYEAYNILSGTGDSVFSPMHERYCEYDEDYRSIIRNGGKIFLSADLVESFFQQQKFKK